MAKRFTDTEKWERPWFRNLPSTYRQLWLYILDHCDMAGIWYVDMEMASLMIGQKLNYKESVRYLDKQIIPIHDNSRWIIKDFLKFQYGELKHDSRVHQGVLSAIKRHSLAYSINSLSIAYQYPINSPKDKDKAKEKAKATIKVKARLAPRKKILVGGSSINLNGISVVESSTDKVCP